MYAVLIVVSVIILICIFTSQALYKFGIPALLIFLVLGMLASADGIGNISFHNYEIAEDIAKFALVLIMFYGGFGTKWATAKPIALRAGLMSSLGTIITAFVIGFFCYLILDVPFLYGLLFGSVVGSTDAASVFTILRSRKLNLKNGLAPLLEVESGSNDPFAYMMTIVVIYAIQAQGSSLPVLSLIGIIALQIGAALAVSVAASFITIFLLKRLKLEDTGFYPILILAIVILVYAICSLIGGNGFLCVYIMGIVVGNKQFLHKISTVHFFDSLSWLMQIMLFFILGLLSYPTKLLEIAVPGILLSVLLIVAARPIATVCILSWFKTPIKQQALVSWVGLRGAASIAFAIVAVGALGDELPYDLFHLVFFVALFSVLIQGTLTPVLSKKLDLIDENEDNSVMKTFTDYSEEIHTRLLEYKIEPDSELDGKLIIDAGIPENNLIIMIKRRNEIIVPRGSTEMMADDILVISGEDFEFFNK